MDRVKQIKPCPFCGGEVITVDTSISDTNTGWLIRCNNCFMTAGMWKTEEEMIVAWNRRVGDE